MKRFSYFIAICLTFLTSCESVDFTRLGTGNLYTGLYQGRDCVVLIDQAEEGNLKGRFYLDEGNMFAPPISFSSNLKKNGKGRLWIKGQERNLSKVTIDEGSVEGDVDEISFSLSLYQESDMQYKAQYIESCNEVAIDQDRIYARNVNGYWKSYPDSGEKFGVIYARKAPSLALTKDLDLDMDVYYPKEPIKENGRPLLMLIHGGAFYNGDKRDVGLPELGRHFAERGYVVASINHRLGYMPMGAEVDRAGYRALQDAHAAVCYLIKNADEFGIDTTKIFAAGISAGAITALNLAFMRDENRPETTRNGGVIGWISSKLTDLKKVTGVFGVDLGIGFNILNYGLRQFGSASDQGPINLVSDSLSCPFQIKAVVNMWGAVHSLEILKNSRQTDILSFHGDSDRIVPYAHDYPFKHVLEPSVDSMLVGFPKLFQPAANIGRKWLYSGKPFNEWAFNPIDGSSKIHDKAISLGLHSELITVKGGKHSMHLDDNRKLSVFFNDTILPTMTRFLCEEMAGGKMVRLDHNGSYVEALDADNVEELHWKVEGGALLDRQGGNKVKVLLFGDAPRHCIMAGGKYKNGVEFKFSILEKELNE